MTRTSLFLTFLAVVFCANNGCGTAEMDDVLAHEQFAETNLPSSFKVGTTQQSSCKSVSPDPTMTSERIEVEVRGNSAKIIHKDAYYNCAAKIQMKVLAINNQVTVREVILNPDETVKCMCHFDLAITVSNLKPGKYVATVINAQGKKIGTKSFMIPEIDICKPMDAKGEGVCTQFLGAAWNGSKCITIGGCRCLGADCDKLYKSHLECQTAHQFCPAQTKCAANHGYCSTLLSYCKPDYFPAGAMDCPGGNSAVCCRSICGLPADRGPCLGAFNRYFFNVRTGQCEVFIYGGCKGNANNFKTLEDCQSKCL